MQDAIPRAENRPQRVRQTAVWRLRDRLNERKPTPNLRPCSREILDSTDRHAMTLRGPVLPLHATKCLSIARQNILRGEANAQSA